MLITPIYLQAAEEKAAAEAATAKVSDSVILETNGALKELCIMGLQTSILLARIYKIKKGLVMQRVQIPLHPLGFLSY